MDCSRHTVTKNFGDQKTYGAIKKKLFKRLNHMNKSFDEVELAKAQIEHKEPLIVGLFGLQNTKLRMFQLSHNFYISFCDVNKFQDLERDKDSL